MTALANPIPPFDLGFRPNPAAVKWGLDTLVDENRRNTPPEVANQRQEKRYSLSELDDVDLNELAKRFARQRYDRRPPVVKALDVIDLPRNVIANVVFPGAAARQAREGERATFGLPRVQFSDALKSMGVENRVVRGVVGFAGDVLLDPLTYLGGTGAGLRLGSAAKGGGEIILSKTGRKVLNRSVTDAARGGGMRAVRDDAAREWFRFRGVDDAAIKRFQTEAMNAGEDVATGVENRVRMAVLGETSRPRVAKILTPLGFDSRIGESPMADAFFAGEDAAQKFVGQYMRGSTALPGFSTAAAKDAGFGVDLLHIPGTDIGLRVAPFGPVGREAGAIARMARAGSTSPLETGAMAAARGASNAAQRGVDDLTPLLETLGESRSAARGAGVLPDLQVDDLTGAIRYAPPTFADVSEQVVRNMKGVADDVASRSMALADVVNKMTGAIPVDKLTPEVLIANMRVSNEAHAEAKVAEASYTSAKSMVGNTTKLRSDRAKVVQARAAELLGTGRPLTPADYAELDTLWRTYGNELDAMQQRLLDLTDQEFDAFKTHADMLHQRMSALNLLRESALRPVLAGLTSEERVVVDVAKRMLGTVSDVQGRQVVAPISQALSGLVGEDAKVVQWLDNMAKAGRSMFGVKTGTLYHEARRFRATTGVGAKAFADGLASQRRDHIVNTLAEVLDKKQLATDFDALDTLVTDLAGARLAAQNPGAAFRLWKFDPKDAHGIMRDADGRPVPNKWYANVLDQQRKGYLNDKLFPGLRARLEQLAQQDIDNWKAVAAQGEEDLDLIAREVYLPNMMTDELRDAIMLGRAAGPDRVVAGRAREATVESFQKRRTSDETIYLFEDANGNREWRMFREWERGYLKDPRYTPQGIASIFGADSETAKRVTNIQRTINDYDQLVDADPEFAARFPARPMHPSDLNDLAMTGELEMLTSRADITRSAFETGSSKIFAKRMMQQQRANARQMLRELLSDQGFVTRRDLLQRAKLENNGVFDLGGVEARVLQSGDDSAPSIIKVGDQKFRSLNTQLLNGDGEMLAKGMGLLDETMQGGAAALFPERAAELIERSFAAFKAPGSLATFLRAVDQATGMWKVTTLFHPSWMVGNILSDMVLAVSTGANPADIARNMRPAMQTVFTRGRKGMERLITAGGETKTVEEWITNAVEHGFIKANITSETAETLLANGVVTLTDPRAFSLRGAQDRWYQAEKIIDNTRKLKDLPPKAKKLPQASVFLGKQAAAMTGAWFKINSQVSDVTRMATYFALRNQGHSDTQAARLVIQNLFDYGDLTNFEQTVMKRMLPFYTWLSSSMKHQIAFALDHPWYAGIYPKLKESLEESYLGDAQVPDHHRPAWLREQLAIQIGADPDSRYAFTVGSLLPNEQLYRTMAGMLGPEGAMDYANFMMAGLNPMARVPMELALGREFFTDRKIGADIYHGEIGAAEHLLSQVRPLREFGNPMSIRRGAVPAAFARSPMEGVGRLALGGRIQPFNEERIGFNNRREMQETEENVRRAFNIAIREGDAGAASRARLELLRLYDAALQLGFSDIVPVWAKDQLARLKGMSDSGEGAQPQGSASPFAPTAAAL